MRRAVCSRGGVGSSVEKEGGRGERRVRGEGVGVAVRVIKAAAVMWREWLAAACPSAYLPSG